jgi:hypothetical protein
LDLVDLADRLRTIEEDLRDRAYDALRSAAEGDEDAAAAEKKILQARRAIERAIRALDPDGGFDEGA